MASLPSADEFLNKKLPTSDEFLGIKSQVRQQSKVLEEIQGVGAFEGLLRFLETPINPLPETHRKRLEDLKVSDELKSIPFDESSTPIERFPGFVRNLVRQTGKTGLDLISGVSEAPGSLLTMPIRFMEHAANKLFSTPETELSDSDRALALKLKGKDFSNIQLSDVQKFIPPDELANFSIKKSEFIAQAKIGIPESELEGSAGGVIQGDIIGGQPIGSREQKTSELRKDFFETGGLDALLLAAPFKPRVKPRVKPKIIKPIVKIEPFATTKQAKTIIKDKGIGLKETKPDIIAETPLPKVQQTIDIPKTKTKQIDILHKDINKIDPVESGKQRPIKEIALKNADAKVLSEFLGRENISISEARDFVRKKQDAKRLEGKELDIADDIIESGRPHSTEEVIALNKKKTQIAENIQDITNKIDAFRVKESFQKAEELGIQRRRLQNEFDRLDDAGIISGSATGSALQARKQAIPTSLNLPEAKKLAKDNKRGKPLSEFEEIKVEAAVKERDIRIKELESAQKLDAERIAKVEADNARLVFNLENKKANIRGRAKIVRKSINQDIAKNKKDLRSLGIRVNDVTGVSAEGAFIIGKLAINYIKKGAKNLKEVVGLVKADIPHLSELDVHKAINSKDPKLVKKQQTATQRMIKEVKKEADLLVKIDNGLRGIIKSESRNKTVIPERIKTLQKQWREIRNGLEESGLEGKRIEKAQKLINELQDQLFENFRPIKSKQIISSGALKQKQIKIKELRRKITDFDTIESLKEQIRNAEKGKFTISNRGIRRNETILQLRKRLKSLRQKSAVIRGVTQRSRITKNIQKLEAELRGNFRAIRKDKGILPEDVKALKEKQTDLRGQINAFDRLKDLEQQMRTKEFKIFEPKIPKKISPELSRAQTKVQIANKELRSLIEGMRTRSGFEKVRHGTLETANTIRTLKATADMSYLLRQGLLASVSRPRVAAHAFGEAFKAAFNKFKAEQIDNALRTSEEFIIGQQNGLHISEIGNKFLKGEEAFVSNLAERIPGYGKIVRASERHMTTGLNILRQGTFNEFLRKYPNATTAELTAWADWINVATGRGNLGKSAAIAESLSQVFFAPRFAVSRIQAPFKIIQNWKNKRVRKEIAKDMAAASGLGLLTLVLADLGGLEVGTDVRDSDFGKIRFENTRVDIFAGIQQPMRMLTRMNLFVTDHTGVTGQDLRKSELTPDWYNLIGTYGKYKTAPVFSLLKEVVEGKDIVGNEVTLPEVAQNVILPLVAQSMVEAYKSDNAAPVGVVGGLEFFGLGVSTFEKKSDKKNSNKRISIKKQFKKNQNIKISRGKN